MDRNASELPMVRIARWWTGQMENPAQDRCPIPGSDLGLRPGSTRLGAVDPAELIDVAVVVRRNPTGPPVPDPLLGGAFVARGDFARLYGATVADLDRVAEVGQTFGLLEQQRSSATRILVLRGSTPSVEAAFGVVLSLYQHETGTYRGHEGPVTVPKQLADIVEGVFGLRSTTDPCPAVAQPSSLRHQAGAGLQRSLSLHPRWLG